MIHLRSLVIGVLVGIGTCLGPLYCHDTAKNATIDSLATAVKDAGTARHAAVESVTVFVPVAQRARAESDRLADIVRVTNATTLSVQLTPASAPLDIEVPAPVAQLIEAQGRTIAEQQVLLDRYAMLAATDSVMINTQAALIAEYRSERRRHCGVKCKAGLAVLGAATLKGLQLLAAGRP